MSEKELDPGAGRQSRHTASSRAKYPRRGKSGTLLAQGFRCHSTVASAGSMGPGEVGPAHMVRMVEGD